MNNMTGEQLIAATRVAAKFESTATAQLLNELATRLDCALAALREKSKHCDASEQAERVWETTMMQACGEDGPASVAAEIKSLRAMRDTALEALRAERDALAAENAALKSWAEDRAICDDVLEQENYTVLKIDWRQRSLKGIKTPATDAFLAEQMAQGVEIAAASYHPLVVTGGSDDPQENGLCVREDLLNIARQLRAGEVQP